MRHLWIGVWLCACTSDTGVRWAHDTVLVVPTDGGFTASQTWTLYGPKWERRQVERHRLCAVVYDLQPRARPADCPACVVAFSADPVRTDGDCAVEDPTFEALRAFGIGTSGDRAVSWMDVGEGWTPHGTREAPWDDSPAGVFPADHAWEIVDRSALPQLRRPPAPP